MKILSNLKGWRTIILGIIQVLSGILTYLGPSEAPQDDRAGLTLIAAGLATIFFRLMTTGPVGGTKPPEE